MIVFVVCLMLVLNFYGNLTAALAVAALAVLALELVLKISGLSDRRQASAKEFEHKKQVITRLKQNSDRENLDFFMQLCRAKCEECREDKDGFIFMSKDGIRMGMFLRFYLAPLSAQQALDCCKAALEARLEQAFILTAAADEGALRTVKGINGLNVRILQEHGVFGILKENSYYPPKPVHNIKQPTGFAGMLRAAVERKRFKGYFFSGLFILALSFLTPYRIYYLLFSCFLLILSAVCLLVRQVSRPDAVPNFFLSK